MAAQAHTTRRALFAAATALSLLAPAAVPHAGRTMALLAERNRVVDWVNAQPCWGEEWEAERLAIHDYIYSLERAIQGAADCTRDTVEAQLSFFERAILEEELEFEPEEVAAVVGLALRYVRGAH